jgi:hypothetical protein
MKRLGRFMPLRAVATRLAAGLIAAAAAWYPIGAAARSANPEPPPAPPAARDTLAAEIDDLYARLKVTQAETRRARAGFNRVLLAGDASPTFTNQTGSPSTFEAGMGLMLLMRLGERLLFEGAFDVGLENDDLGNGQTSFDLAHANLSYLVSDYVTFRAGLFLVPFGVYHNHFDPSWIDPFPDAPLAMDDGGIVPEGVVGVEIDTSVPIGRIELHGHLYVVNGPRLVTGDSSAAGTLAFDNFQDDKNRKTVGGRLALRPAEGLELGYSVMYGRVGTGAFSGVGALLQGVDAEYRADIGRLRGRIDLRSEIALSRVDRAEYGPTASPAFGPVSFENRRDGGYVQAGFRPWMIERRFIRNVEGVVRYDWLRAPLDAPGGDREERLIAGLDYWFRPTLVLKAAYEFDEKKLEEDADTFFLQMGIGL